MEKFQPTKFTEEERKAYESMQALRWGSEFFRNRIKEVANRCWDPQKGRALRGGLYLALDEEDNPVIRAGGADVITLLPDGILFPSKRSYGYRLDGRGIINFFITNYTDWVWKNNYEGNRLVPKDIQEQVNKAGYTSHFGNVDGSPARAVNLGVTWHTDGCDACQEAKQALAKITAAIKAKEEEYIRYAKSLNIYLDKDDDVFIPYSFNDTNFKKLPDYLVDEVEKVRTARKWKRREKKTENV